MENITNGNNNEKCDIDILNVDPELLRDINEITIDPDKPLPQRMTDFIAQIGNPYCFRCGDIIIKLEFLDTETTFEECAESFFNTFSESVISPPPNQLLET